MSRACIGAVAVAIGLAAGRAGAQEVRAPELVGLWEAVRIFGPEIRGTLLLLERDGRLVADIAGYAVPVSVEGDQYSFEIGRGENSFRGRRSGDVIRGFWTQPASVAAASGRRFATPVTLLKQGGMWRGEVTPMEDRFSYYLPITRAADGSLATYLRNPDRNDGVFTQVKSVAVEGSKVSLVGNRRGSKEQRALYEGRFADGVLSIPGRGGTFDFRRVVDVDSSPFFPRGPPMTSISSGQIHSVLIARHGKLVLEEYFHGHHRDLPHDTRSASKSLAAVVIGAAMQSGIEIGPETPVYATMLERLPADLDPRKRGMTLEHLLMMRGGHFCNDSNPDSPGNEDAMQDQDREPDWFRFILALPMDRTPGEKTIYCSIDAHLAGGVTAKVAGEPWADLFDRLVARPLKFGTYHLFLAPTGEAYNGGGHRLLPRDFLKVAQLMLDDGAWEGRQIVPKEWARKSTAALADLNGYQQYGYLWNSAEYPYRGRKVRAFFAAGNGGQIFMGIPDLDLAIAFTGGSYADASLLIPQRQLVPEQILPAVD